LGNPSLKSPQPPFAKAERGDFWEIFSEGQRVPRVLISEDGVYISGLYAILKRVVKTGKERSGPEVEDSKEEIQKNQAAVSAPMR
jgi:hypothetical protein